MMKSEDIAAEIHACTGQLASLRASSRSVGQDSSPVTPDGLNQMIVDCEARLVTLREDFDRMVVTEREARYRTAS